MTRSGLWVMLPMGLTAAAAVFLLVAIAAKRSFEFVHAFSLAAAGGALLSVFWASRSAPRTVTPLFVMDRFALFYIGLLLACAVFVLFLAGGYLRALAGNREEFFLLLFLALLGAEAMAASRHFVSLFLGLEISSLSLAVLIAYPADRRESSEAGIKFLILSSASAAFLLFGMALVYAGTGRLDLPGLAAALAAPGAGAPPAVPALGLSLMIVALGFKLALAPFHMWAPDVYQGAPAPVAAFVSTASKAGMFVFLIRFFTAVDVRNRPSLLLVFGVIAAASMFAGNLLALLQSSVKRILACSSIAHMGYVLVAFPAGGAAGIEAVSFYLAAYAVAVIAAFGVVIRLSRAGEDADSLREYRGLFWRRPGTAAVFAAALLSLAGIPLTAGFIGKFYIASAGVRASSWLLVAALIVNSVIGLYYYLRIIVTMAAAPEAGAAGEGAVPRSWTEGAAMIVLVLLLFWIGIFPGGLIKIVRASGSPAILEMTSASASGRGGPQEVLAEDRPAPIEERRGPEFSKGGPTADGRTMR